jgi:ATP-dependent RNA helicase SUPV3L1/SUV3
VLRAAPLATDLQVLKRLADEPWVRDRVRRPAMVARLWAACGIPDFRKVGIDPHARFVSRVFGHLSEGLGHVPHQWFADEIARLDSMAGDVETLAGRLSAIRSWAYIAQRADWLADPKHWAERTREIEERLSDGLHASLTQRFVDKRTTALIRRIGADAGVLPVTIGPEGEVLVEDHPIGRLEGFRFTVEAGRGRTTRGCCWRRPKAARHRAVAAGRGADRHRAGGAHFGRGPAGLGGARRGPAGGGPSLGRPVVRLERDLDCLSQPLRERVKARLDGWVARALDRNVPALVRLAALAREAKASPALRAVAAALEDAGGIVPRQPLRLMIDALSPEERRRLRGLGITIGTLDIFDARLLKPAAAARRRTLMTLWGQSPELARIGATTLRRDEPGRSVASGFRPLGDQAVRIDLVERIARATHDARATGAGRLRPTRRSPPRSGSNPRRSTG